MATPLTSVAPDIRTDAGEQVETGEPTHAHIVKVEPGEDAAAKVLEARVMGTPLEAICGHVWIPSRDPKQLPLCSRCKALYEIDRAFNEHLREVPDS